MLHTQSGIESPARTEDHAEDPCNTGLELCALETGSKRVDTEVEVVARSHDSTATCKENNKSYGSLDAHDGKRKEQRRQPHMKFLVRIMNGIKPKFAVVLICGLNTRLLVFFFCGLNIVAIF